MKACWPERQGSRRSRTAEPLRRSPLRSHTGLLRERRELVPVLDEALLAGEGVAEHVALHELARGYLLEGLDRGEGAVVHALLDDDVARARVRVLGGGYTLVSRFDYFWQARMWGRIFNDTSDRINSYGNGNVQFTLNSPDNVWYVRAFARNVFNTTNTTGEYLTSSSSGLWTGVFYGDPRIIGVGVGAHF